MWALALVIGFLFLFGSVNAISRYRTKKLAATRGTYSQEQFVNYFSNDEIRPDVLLEVRRFLQEFLGMMDFPVLPNDNLYQVYGLCEDDLESAVFEIAETCGCGTPTTEAVEDLPPVQSVADLVKLLSRLC